MQSGETTGQPTSRAIFSVEPFLLYTGVSTAMKNKYPIGILGATGMVGQRYIQLLENHPWFEIAWLAASDRSSGKPYGEAAKWRLDTPLPERIAKMTVAPADPEGAPKIVFASVDAAIARELEPTIRRCRLRGALQFQRLPHDAQRAAGDSRDQRGAPASHRGAALAQAVGRLHGDQSQLLHYWPGDGAQAHRGALRH